MLKTEDRFTDEKLNAKSLVIPLVSFWRDSTAFGPLFQTGRRERQNNSSFISLIIFFSGSL